MLDSFFGSLSHQDDWRRVVSDRGFAKARDRLNWTRLDGLNSFVMQCANAAGLVPRWHGLRLVAANASVLMHIVCASFTNRLQASADQRLFALYLSDTELTLHASLHRASTAERQMLFEALQCLGPLKKLPQQH